MVRLGGGSGGSGGSSVAFDRKSGEASCYKRTNATRRGTDRCGLDMFYASDVIGSKRIHVDLVEYIRFF